MTSVDSVSLLTWFSSTADSPGVVTTCSVDDMLTTAMQRRTGTFANGTTLGFESSHAPLSPALQASTNNPAH